MAGNTEEKDKKNVTFGLEKGRDKAQRWHPSVSDPTEHPSRPSNVC